MSSIVVVILVIVVRGLIIRVYIAQVLTVQPLATANSAQVLTVQPLATKPRGRGRWRPFSARRVGRQHMLVRYRVLAVGGGGVEDLSTLQIEAVRVLLSLAIHERAHCSVGGLLDSTLHRRVDRWRPRSRRGRWRLLPMVG